jgi:hypothetical protein
MVACDDGEEEHTHKHANSKGTKEEEGKGIEKSEA